MPFRFLEHTSDQLVEVEADTLEKLFVDAALATFETMTDISKVEPEEVREFTLEDDNLESLLIAFLNELLFYVDAENMMFSKFKVKIEKNGKYKLRCKAYGEPFDASKHESRYVVKAATYHMLRVAKNKRWHATFLLDL